MWHAIVLEPDDSAYAVLSTALAEIDWAVQRAATPADLVSQARSVWAIFVSVEAMDRLPQQLTEEIRLVEPDIAIVGIGDSSGRDELLKSGTFDAWLLTPLTQERVWEAIVEASRRR